MMIRALLASIVLLAASSTLALGQVKHQVDASVRFKLSVVMSIDGQEVEASTVQELGVYVNSIPWMVPSQRLVLLKGQTLAFDIRDRGTIIVPMRQLGADYPYESILIHSCVSIWPAELGPREFLSSLVKDAPCTVPPNAFPMFLFVDKTSGAVSAARVADLSTIIGANVRLVSMVVTPVKEALTTGRLEAIPWLVDLLDGKAFELKARGKSRSISVHRRDFIAEDF